jgi:hypothetical protein
MKKFYSIDLNEIAITLDLPNQDQAKQGLVKMINYDEQTQNLFPTSLTPDDLQKFTITPEHHENYSRLWYGLTYANVFANMFLWLYL